MADLDDKLLEAIDKANLVTLRMMFKHLCRQLPAATEEAARCLLTPTPTNKKRKAEDQNKNENAMKTRKTVGATTVVFERSVVCREVYDVADNPENSCRTHPGVIYVYPDSYPDDDYVQYGPSPKDWRDDWRFREGGAFAWSCCGRYAWAHEDYPDATDEPCHIQRHISAWEQGESHDRRVSG